MDRAIQEMIANLRHAARDRAIQEMIANLRHAARDRQTAAIGGGLFGPPVCGAAADRLATAGVMLSALDRLTAAFPELGTEEPINGADAVDRLCELWPVIQAARAKARGV